MPTTLSIVIPVYQHAAACLRCLDSLKRQTRLPDEIVIVDDASTDNLEEKLGNYLGVANLQNAQSSYPVPIRYVRFAENKGAPAARNEGARRTTGDYLLFLDADIELDPTLLERFAGTLDAHPEIDIVYSAYDFGWTFPLVPFSVERLKQGNFIHTSSLLRRAAFPGFDESLKKFQDWDLWLTMVERGSRALGLPEVLFRVDPRKTGYSHWLPSFVYGLPWKKLGWAPRLVAKYQNAETIIREKHGLPNTAPIKASASFTSLRSLLAGVGVLAVVEAVSFFTVFHPRVNTGLCVMLGIAMIVFSLKRPTLALTVLMVEFLIGSKGALFYALGDERNNGGVSIRIILFSAFFLGWLVDLLRSGRWKVVVRQVAVRWEYLLLAALLGLALLNGILRHNGFVLADANAWGLWLLLLPALDLIPRATKSELECLATWGASALLWVVVKTVILFYLFSHAFPVWLLEPIYQWVRRTGVGEITRAGGNIFRIFFQSHIYGLILLPGAVLAARVKKARIPLLLVGFATLFLAQTLVSLSRSFFLGLAATGVLTLVFAWRDGGLKAVGSGIGRWIAILMAAVGLLVVVCFFPLPRSSSSLLNAWQSRISANDDASASRWKLLPAMWEKIKEHPIVGSGFGATVTYTSRDPRVVQTTGGTYTTYAFEWGWLEHWIKFGILGIPLLLFILGRIAWRIQQSSLTLSQKRVVWLSLIGLAIVHVSTPYLNHPLGFAWLIGIEGIAERWKTS